MAMVASNMSSHLPAQLTRSLERILEEAHLSGELKLCGRKLKDFPNSRGKYDLSDTVIADLSKNRFGELPAEVTEYIFLEKLVLYHNAIRSIPDSVVYLQSLVYLDLSRNQLSSLPSSLCQLPLEVLLVANNRLGALPDELGRLKTLAELDASCNEICRLPRRMAELPALRVLNLRRNLLTELPAEVTELCLERLDISSNRISKLPVELRNMASLVQLHLGDNPIISPPPYLCTRGRVHIFKYLEIQSLKEDKKKGVLNEEIRKVHRKATHLADLRITNGLGAEKRYTTDSGYSTSEDKRWSQDLRGMGIDEMGRLRGTWPRQDSLPLSLLASDTNGSCSAASTPSTISPGDSPNLEDELAKAIAESTLEKEDGRIIQYTKEGMKATNGSPRYPSNSVNTGTISNGPALSPSAEVIVNGIGLVPSQEDTKRPLEHIQTYREYKEALRQQRSQDVYRPRLSTTAEGDSPKQTNHFFQEEDPSQIDFADSASKGDVQKAQRHILEETGGRRPVQRVPPSRNGAAVAPQDSSIQPSSLANGSRGPDSPGGCYVKPSSPIRTPTSLAHFPGMSSTVPGSPQLVTASVSYVTPVPMSSNGGRAYGQGSPRQPKIGTSRGVPWNRDLPPDKLSFTMRREFDKAREEAELTEQLRNHIETRLKMALPDDMSSALSDGVVLCHLANHVRPRSVASIHVPSPAVPKLTMARCRRNVDNFLEACRRIGVDEALICCASDVLEGRGTVQVAITVCELLKFHQPRSPTHVSSVSS